MSHEAEALLVIYFYLAIGLVVLSVFVIILVFAHIKKIMDETSIFIKLMIGLYEQEKQKSEKIDEGGFGT